MSRKILFTGEQIRYKPVRDPYTGEVQRDQYGLEVTEIDYEHENAREMAIEGTTIYVLPVRDGRGRKTGFTRQYTFGPSLESFVQEMPEADAELALTLAHTKVNLKDVTDEPNWKQRYFRTAEQLAESGGD